MKRTTINLSLPLSMRKFVESRVETSGYGSVSEYMRELIRRDQNLIRTAEKEERMSQMMDPYSGDWEQIGHDHSPFRGRRR